MDWNEFWEWAWARISGHRYLTVTKRAFSKLAGFPKYSKAQRMYRYLMLIFRLDLVSQAEHQILHTRPKPDLKPEKVRGPFPAKKLIWAIVLAANFFLHLISNKSFPIETDDVIERSIN